MAFCDEHSVEGVDLGFVDQEGFEEDGDDEVCFAEDEEGGVDPGGGAAGVEEEEDGDLGEVEG